jgi:hypothetical protein
MSFSFGALSSLLKLGNIAYILICYIRREKRLSKETAIISR